MFDIFGETQRNQIFQELGILQLLATKLVQLKSQVLFILLFILFFKLLNFF